MAAAKPQVDNARIFRGIKDPIIEYKDKKVNGIEIISSIQERIVFSDKRIITVYGCAGSLKTDSLCKYGLKQYREKKNVMFLTLVSSVTDEIKNRVAAMFDVNLTKGGNHYYGPAAKARSTVEIATFDAFIYKQLDHMQESNGASGIYDDVITVDESTYKQRMYKLLNSSHDKFVMKNDKLADVILIDEFQDLEMDKRQIVINILKHNPAVKCMVIGDYLQTIFDRSIVVDDILVDHPFEFWQKSFINEESYEDFEINICYRCPKPQIDFINHIMGGTEPRLKYQISEMTTPEVVTLKTQTVHKPFIFIHEDIGSNGSENTNGAYIADQTFRIINAIIENDVEEKLSYADVTILMIKSNGQPVFKQLEILMNTKSENVLHVHETKGDGYHDRIDWAKSEGKAAALSIHGYKGRGNKIIVLLGLNSMIMPRKDNVGTPKELIDYSLLNVGLSRSTKYLIVGITSSSPTKYFYDRKETFEDYAYCSWEPQLMPPVYEKIRSMLYASKWNNGEGRNMRCFANKMKPGVRHWHTDRCKIRRDMLLFDPYFYKDNKIYPKHRVATVSDSVCDVVDDPDEILAGCTKGNKIQFGTPNGFDSKTDDYEKKILGVVVEWIVNRYLYTNCGDVDFLKYMSFLLNPESDLVYFTNNETLLNLVADKCTNLFAIHHIYDSESRKSGAVCSVWKQLFDEIEKEHDQLLNRDTTGLVSKLNMLSEGLPKMIVHSNFRNDKFTGQLLSMCDNKTNNESIESEAFWNFGLFQMLLFERIRTPFLSSYYGRMNYDLTAIHRNTEIYCKQLLQGKPTKILKQLSHGLSITVNEDLILGSRTKKRFQKKAITVSDIYADDTGDQKAAETQSKPFVISGRSDLFVGNKIVEIKASAFMDMSPAWITQALSYCCLPLNSTLNGKEYEYNPKSFQIVNLLKGVSYDFELPSDFNKRKCTEAIMKKLKWPGDIINEYFQHY